MRWTFLAGLTLLSLCGCASGPATPGDLLALDVDRFRFGLYRDCIEAGAARIEPPSVTAAKCDCAYEYLGREVAEREWRKAAFLHFSGRDDEERGLLAPYLRGAGACLRLSTVEMPGSGSAPAAADRLVGGWAWTRPHGNCRERYEFRPNGTVRIERGDERTENSFVVAPAAGLAGRYRITLTTTWYAAGAACDAGIREARGRVSSLFALFGPGDRMLAICKSDFDADCDGPLRRVAAN